MNVAAKSSLKSLSLALLFGAGMMQPQGLRATPNEPAEPEISSDAAGPDAAIPDELLLPKDEQDNAEERQKLLGELYERLRKSADEDDAKVVANAIENLWQRSGSDTVDLLMRRSAKLMEEEDFDVALDILNSVIDIAPDYSEGWTRRAAVFFLKKEFTRSMDDLRHALALDPSHYKAIQGLALLMQELGEKEAALEAFRRLLQIHPHLDDALQAIQELTREVEGQGI